MNKLTDKQERILINTLGAETGAVLIALVNLWMGQNYSQTFDYAWEAAEQHCDQQEAKQGK